MDKQKRFDREKGKIDYDDIDVNIRDLIHQFNTIPWVLTDGCCEGHFTELNMKTHTQENIIDALNNQRRGYISFSVLDDTLVEIYFLPFIEELKLKWGKYEIELNKEFHFDPHINYKWRLRWHYHREDSEKLILFEKFKSVIEKIIELEIK